jgi:hypothetical protein
LVDLRKEKVVKWKSSGIINKENLMGDPLGYSPVNLGKNTELLDIVKDYGSFRVTQYNKDEMLKHHNADKNEYLISNSVLNSDVIINLPKLKSHRKAGMTCALKNMIGINGSKDWLPHHRLGSVEEGGDEYLHKSKRKRMLTRLKEKRDVTTNKFQLTLLRIPQFLITATRLIYPHKDPYFEGSWYGNDTVPRTITDINKILFYADSKGEMRNKPQRKMFIIVDAIIAGEKEGPMEPSPKKCGTLLGSQDPVAMDLACSRIMGFDYNKIPTFKYALNSKKHKITDIDPEEIEIVSAGCERFKDIYKVYGCDFIPTSGWKEHIEYERMG